MYNEMREPLIFNISKNRLTCHSEMTEPVTNIFYLKIHKCSSTTMQTMFARYALQNNLKTVVFYPAPHTFPHPVLSPFVFDKFKDVKQYNMLTSHIVFAENQIRQLLPGNAKFVTILREPFSLLQSQFKYYRLCAQFRMERCSLEAFLDQPQTYDIRANRSYGNSYVASYTKNLMARHLGFDDFGTSRSNVMDWIQYIDHRFDFIGLVEYFPESLVYMKRIFNWDLDDILYLSLRNTTSDSYTYSRLHSRPMGIDITKTRDLTNKYKKWSPIDYDLYQYFLQKFHATINSFGEDFHQEVNTFKEIQLQASEFCSNWCQVLNELERNKTIGEQIKMLRSTTLKIGRTKWNDEFNISLEDCLLMMLNPDSVRGVFLKRHTQGCTGPECQNYLAHNLPVNGLKYLSCIGKWGFNIV